MAPVSELLRCVEEDEREHALDLALAAIRRGRWLSCQPTRSTGWALTPSTPTP
jgi:hypothetical protein